MAIFALLAALGLMALVLRARSRSTCLAAAVLNVVFAGLLTGYVLRTPPGSGQRSAWRLRVDGGEHALYFATMGVAGAAAFSFALLALRGLPDRPLRGAPLVSGGLDLVLGWLVLTAFAID